MVATLIWILVALIGVIVILTAIQAAKKKKTASASIVHSITIGAMGGGSIFRNIAIVVALIVTGVAYYYWTPDPATISAFMWQRIVATVVLAALTYALARIFLPKEDHQKVGVGLVALAFLLVTMTVLGKNPEMVAYLQGVEPPRAQVTESTCSEIVPGVWRHCLWSEEWVRVRLTADHPLRENEYRICIASPNGNDYDAEQLGPNLWRFRSKHGRLPIDAILGANNTCPSNI
jgi:hypothetical protein